MLSKEEKIRNIVNSHVSAFANVYVKTDNEEKQKYEINEFVNGFLQNKKYFLSTDLSLNGAFGKLLNKIANKIMVTNFNQKKKTKVKRHENKKVQPIQKLYPVSVEVMKSKKFWNIICNMPKGYNIVVDEIKKTNILISKILEKVGEE